MATTEIKNIFLSASIPLPERDAKYIDSADIIAIRDAVIALTSIVLPKYRLVWGGHPSITPLVYHVCQKMKIDIQEHVHLYQSKFFEKFYPEDNNKFKNVTLTDVRGDKDESLKFMREEMLGSGDFYAGVFIGGMDGVEDEYKMFREAHPEALIIPLASTGAAAKIIFDSFEPREQMDERFLKDYSYTSLFHTLLIDKID